MAIKSLYIHIPFCKHICHFCDFTKLLVNDQFVFPYMAKIFNDLDFLVSCNEKYDTIYIGGGTPTSLGDDYFEHLLKACHLLLNTDGEFTCEANVENLTRKKLILMEKNGVNRLSVGIQTFDDNLLKDIHRHHCADESIENIKLAKLFIKNINCDFIYGLPNQSLKILKNDVKKALELKVTHLSFYSLTINKGTEFFNRGIKEINQDESREFYDYILKKLTKAGYIRYEVSNFAKPGYECKHNINY